MNYAFLRIGLAAVIFLFLGIVLLAAAFIPFVTNWKYTSWIDDRPILGILYFFVLITAVALLLRAGAIQVVHKTLILNRSGQRDESSQPK